MVLFWWLLIPAAPAVAVAAKYIYDLLTEEEKKPQQVSYTPPTVTPRRFHFDVRGAFEGKSVLVVGRTGAGKSSLINMVRGERLLAVGTIGSTTRWIEGVPCHFGPQTLTLVDSPGVGEVYTDADYNSGIEDWFSSNHLSVACILLVLQADTKGHADDKRLLDSLASVTRKPVIIALNQADKISPVREDFRSTEWDAEKFMGSEKSRNIIEKIEVVARQFAHSQDAIIPVASEPSNQFNKSGLVRAIQASA